MIHRHSLRTPEMTASIRLWADEHSDHASCIGILLLRFRWISLSFFLSLLGSSFNEQCGGMWFNRNDDGGLFFFFVSHVIFFSLAILTSISCLV